MIEITIEEARQKARELEENQRKWHFHVLFPGCVFNESEEKNALVMEDRTSDVTYVVYSDQSMTTFGNELMRNYFSEIYPDHEDMESGGKYSDHEILDQCRRLQQEGTAWHHHMLYPDCIFNDHKGKWNLVFESREAGLYLNETSEEEPLDILQQLEFAYFQQYLPNGPAK